MRLQGVDDRPKKTVIYKPTEQEQQVVVAHRGINLNGRRVSISELAVFTICPRRGTPQPHCSWPQVHTFSLRIFCETQNRFKDSPRNWTLLIHHYADRSRFRRKEWRPTGKRFYFPFHLLRNPIQRKTVGGVSRFQRRLLASNVKISSVTAISKGDSSFALSNFTIRTICDAMKDIKK